jgi:exodeoxyribonuclease V alpha subunit
MMVRTDPAVADPLDSRRALAAPGLLGAFNEAGVLGPADVHVALRLAGLGHEPSEVVALAAALAVRGPRFGHVHVDVRTVQATVAADSDEEVDVGSLPWPEPDGWLDALAASPLVAVGEDGPPDRPLRLVGSALYLDRYWRDEVAVAADLLARARSGRVPVDESVLAEGLRTLFRGDGSGEQGRAATAAVTRPLSVIAGGPGTGKTTTVGRILALLDQQATACGRRLPLVALVAPTGKAASRMEEAVRTQAATLDVDPEIRRRLQSVTASTIHRLLGRRPDTFSRFRHDRHNRLPHDVVIIDEASMVPLSLMARLTEAVRPDARLVLVGDPEQLASVEAGAVLGDIVGPALSGAASPAGAPGAPGAPGRIPGVDAGLDVTGRGEPGGRPRQSGGIGDAIVVLRSTHRFRGALADLAAAVRSGAADRAVEILSSGDPAVQWFPVDPDPAAGRPLPELVPEVREALITAGAGLWEAAAVGAGRQALDVLDRFRLLCAHRRGPSGVSAWTERIEALLSGAVDGFSAEPAWYVGRPVIITANDYGLRLFNGDTGVVVARADGRLGVVFRRGESVTSISPSRLSSVETVFAMTVHKAQGSEFEKVAVVLPPATSPLLTRELLYTAVTRARESVVLVGNEESVRAAIGRPIARASGLTRRLWSTEEGRAQPDTAAPVP